MTLSSLNLQLIGTLRDLYAVEMQLTKAIPRLLEAASSDELKSLLQRQLTESEHHIDRLEGCAKNLQERLSGERSRPVDALVKDALNLAESKGNECTIDLGFLNILRHITHYQLAGYEYARSLSDVLDESDSTSFLAKTFAEEEALEQALTVLTHDMLDTVVAHTVRDISLARASSQFLKDSAEKTDYDAVG